MEEVFLDRRLERNPFQDPMGNDAHQGLERFLDKFHQPSIPGYTIITDPEYYIFLWFHDANGKLIPCPYVDERYVTKLHESSVNFYSANFTFADGVGIQSGSRNADLKDSKNNPNLCIDLTPFVREATLPEIAPAGADKIKTLFGETQAGSFSPYASDGSKPITLSVLDTEYCILDAIFYPWMKDINSPWWYREDTAYTEMSTPYPMATLEVQRPRMRYTGTGASAKQSRTDENEYLYYSYKFIGVKPVNYASFSVNGAGPQQLLRSLSLIADMCLVDMVGDVAGSSSASPNFGNRSAFIFSELPEAADDSTENEDDGRREDLERDLDEQREQLDDVSNLWADLLNELEQDFDDMPGEDEPEWMGRLDDYYNPDEYVDEYGDEYGDDVDDNPDGADDDSMFGESDMDYDSESDSDELDSKQSDEEEDVPEEWEDYDEPVYGDEDPNGDLNDFEMENDEWGDESDESGFFDGVLDTMMDVGSDVADAAGTALGWLADGASSAMGLAAAAAGAALGVATDVADTAVGVVTDAASGALDVASNMAQNTIGAASDIVSTTLGAVGDVAGTSLGVVSDLAGNVLPAIGTNVGSALGTVSNATKGLLGGLLGGTSDGQSTDVGSGGPFAALGSAMNGLVSTGNTAFGVVSNVASSAFGASRELASSVASQTSGVVQSALGAASKTTTMLGGVLNKGLSTAFSAVGSMVGNTGNIVGGVLNRLAGSNNAKAVPAGAVNQLASATSEVRNAGVMISALNAASSTIQDSLGLVDRVASSVLKTGGGVAASAVGGLGRIVTRMTESSGNRPTPIESYVTMVTKHSAAKMTSSGGMA